MLSWERSPKWLALREVTTCAQPSLAYAAGDDGQFSSLVIYQKSGAEDHYWMDQESNKSLLSSGLAGETGTRVV